MRVILANGEGWSGMAAAVDELRRGRCALDVLEAGIRCVEDDLEVHSVGTGALPNMLGELELDAAVMDGATRMAGAVGALKGFRHPVSVARKVMERLPFVLLVGEGAARFAAECAAERAEGVTEDSRRRWEEWLEETVPPEYREGWPDVSLVDLWQRMEERQGSRGHETPDNHDTVIYIVLDAGGHLGVGTSTSGLAWKYPGRVGDSPLVGSGLYADDRWGAAACIGNGELAIRTCAARSMVLSMKTGRDVREACREAADEVLSLTGARGEAVGKPLTLFAVDPMGRHHVVALGEKPIQGYGIWTEEMPAPEQRAASRL